jgi:hypothetical protein
MVEQVESHRQQSLTGTNVALHSINKTRHQAPKFCKKGGHGLNVVNRGWSETRCSASANRYPDVAGANL